VGSRRSDACTREECCGCAGESLFNFIY
jgi:hypothetical protein